DRAVERGLETRRRDELHRPRDLADVAHRLAALDEDSAIRHTTDPPYAVFIPRAKTALKFEMTVFRLSTLSPGRSPVLRRPSRISGCSLRTCFSSAASKASTCGTGRSSRK